MPATTGKPLRSGFTTGACAAAAAKGAALMLREQQPVETVDINLPTGQTVTFRLRGQTLTPTGACCYVVKDAGDDPDITNGAEIHAAVDCEFFTRNRLVLRGGEGVGRITKPGLAVPVGEWAINPVPRGMILEGVKEVLAMRCIPATFTVTISIPNGEALAAKTLNARLGIIGGLSILGTTGIVRPISAKAWTDTIACAVDVARAAGSNTVVLSTGRSSELAAQSHFGSRLPEEAYVMMGDHVGSALSSCGQKGVREVVLACQFAKLLKIAAGHQQTHVAAADLDLQQLASWCAADPRTTGFADRCRQANTARQLLEESGNDPALMALVAVRAVAAAQAVAPGLALRVLLAGYRGEVLYFA